MARRIGLTRRTRRPGTAAALKAAQLAVAAPQVIAMRTARMLAAGAAPNARDRREFTRMGSEKVQAYWESMTATALQMQKANQELAFLAVRQFWSAWTNPAWRYPFGGGPAVAAALRTLRSGTTQMSNVFDKGLAPVHRRATGNVRRLRSTKRR